MAVKINLGCGSTKIKGCINIDVEPKCKPDLVCNFMKEDLPYADDTVDEVLFFHTIEHIQKKNRQFVLDRIWRVLKPNGRLVVSYPEFTECFKRWLNNERGMKDFWEATLYGRQLYPSDYHVAIIHSPDLKQELLERGFDNIRTMPEKLEAYNSVTVCYKADRLINYEQLVYDDMKTVNVLREPNNDE